MTFKKNAKTESSRKFYLLVSLKRYSLILILYISVLVHYKHILQYNNLNFYLNYNHLYYNHYNYINITILYNL